MASSYFEVKETVNDDVLPFGLEACEENGISLTSQLDGDLPKDHTYTKEPDIVLDKSDEEKEETIDEDEMQKPPGRSQRNVKPHKFIKTDSPKDNKSKKDTTARKKNAVIKVQKKVTPKQSKNSTRKDTLNNKKEVVPPAKQEEEESKIEEAPVEVENGTIEDAPEQSKSKRRIAKKRKIEEKENIAEEEPPSSDVALIENSIVGEKAVEVKKSKPVRKSTPPAVPSPKKRKVPVKVEKEVAKKVTKGKISTSNKGNVTEDKAGLPKGWTRKIVVRQSGRTAGQIDVYIYNPEGLKFRSKPDVAAYLARTKSNLKLDSFNFSKRVTDIPKPASVPARNNKTQPAKSKDRKNKLTEKNPAPTSTSKRAQKLVVKLKFSASGKRNTGNKKRGLAVSNTPKKSKAGSQRSSRKTK